MKDIREQPKPDLEIKFHDERKLVVVSGLDEQVLDVYKKILIEKRRSEADADYLVDEARAFLKGHGQFEPEYTFGVTERVKVRRDRFGEWGRRNNALLLYLPNSPSDEREEAETISRIRETMKKIGYDI